ncbi:MAG: hypothetical protein Q8M16_17970 [Pirellulaceae bacterium]|nr:hypothetical protein [Pirellulaceae bacterium]
MQRCNLFGFAFSSDAIRTRSWYCCILAVILFGHSTRTIAQSTDEKPPTIDEALWNTLEGSEPWPTELIEVGELPDPDDSIAPLIKTGNIEFKFYDANKIRRRFTGETRMAMKYYTDVKFRWRLVRAAGKRQLTVTVEHRPTRFETYHQILLPREHAHAQMYSVPLVLHELDHVRIVIDPRYQAQFEEWFQEDTKSLTIELDSRTKESEFNALIQAEIQAKSVPCFEKVLQLIQIRNRELDRRTQHGRVPLDEKFFGSDEDR